MGKVEQDARIEDFKRAMNERNYNEAVHIADTLDIKRIKDNNLLGLILPFILCLLLSQKLHPNRFVSYFHHCLKVLLVLLLN